MPINGPAARIGNGSKVQPAPGKYKAGVVTVWDGNFSNNYDGVTNCRGASHIHYGEGECVEYVHGPTVTPDDNDALVDGVHEYGYRDFPEG